MQVFIWTSKFVFHIWCCWKWFVDLSCREVQLKYKIRNLGTKVLSVDSFLTFMSSIYHQGNSTKTYFLSFLKDDEEPKDDQFVVDGKYFPRVFFLSKCYFLKTFVVHNLYSNIKVKCNLNESGGNRKMHASLVNVLTEKIPTYNSIVRRVLECYEKMTCNAISKCISTC